MLIYNCGFLQRVSCVLIFNCGFLKSESRLKETGLSPREKCKNKMEKEFFLKWGWGGECDFTLLAADRFLHLIWEHK